MPREAELRLEKLLTDKAPGTTRGELAVRLGVSEATLRGYIENRWTVLDRTVLERLADFFECDVAELLATTESGFLSPLRDPSRIGKYPGRPTCLYLRRPNADIPHNGRSVAYRDDRAIDRVTGLLRTFVDGALGIKDAATTPEQFGERLTQNCVSVGSPMVNPATEMAICRIFGAQPFDSAERANLPFVFKIPGKAATPSSVFEPSRDGKLGIWLRDEEALLEADAWPSEQFRRMRIDRGRDCAVIVVLNHRVADPVGGDRKLIVLSGFSGLGTEASASALVQHYRDLEPRGDLAFTWGVIEVFYRKQANDTDREILHYNWRCRRGGRCPIEFGRRRT